MIYLDYSANTPVDPEVLARFCETEQRFFGNPNSAHQAGREAAQELRNITQRIADLLGVHPAEVIFTSGASESNNTAIKGIIRASRHYGRHIISTPLEHPSVSGTLTFLQEQGYEIDLVDIDRSGKVDLKSLSNLLREDTVLVAVAAVDSELGTVQPIGEIARLVTQYPHCHLHVDATQALGKLPFSFDGIHTASITPHKFYGLNGSGILLKRAGLVIEPLIHGGVSSSLYRSGTPTLALAAAAETALELAINQLEQRRQTVQELNDALRAALGKYPKVAVNSPPDAIPHILNLSVSGVKGGAFQQALDAQGVCVSVKSACSVPNTPSRAVMAVSGNRKRALSSWRISLSHLTSEDELAQFLGIFDACYHTLTKEVGK